MGNPLQRPRWLGKAKEIGNAFLIPGFLSSFREKGKEEPDQTSHSRETKDADETKRIIEEILNVPGLPPPLRAELRAILIKGFAQEWSLKRIETYLRGEVCSYASFIAREKKGIGH